MTVTLSIPWVSPSQNKTDRMHWSKRAEIKRQLGVLVLLAIRNSANHNQYRATGPRALRMVRFSQRLLDVPNIIGGAKGLIDELVAHGLLVDDDPKHLPMVSAENAKIGSKIQPWTQIELIDL
jgi:hypothetical protein